MKNKSNYPYHTNKNSNTKVTTNIIEDKWIKKKKILFWPILRLDVCDDEMADAKEGRLGPPRSENYDDNFYQLDEL